MDLVNILLRIFILAPISLTYCQQQLTKASLNIKCSSDANCTLNAYCHSTGACYCKGGYSPYREQNVPGKRAYHTICLKEASFIGDYCTADVQCKATFGTHAMCHLNDSSNRVGRCECLHDAHYRDGLCYKTALIGEICEVSDNCLIKSKHIQAFCDIGRCICPPKHHPAADATDCQVSSVLGGPCLDNTGCVIFNSECRYGFCKCRPKFISSDSKNYCLPVAEKLEDSCEEHEQCTTFLQNSKCDEKSGVCVCENGGHNVEGSCWKSARLLEPCANTAECIINKTFQHSVTCNSGICQCRDGYSFEEQSYCLQVNIPPTSKAQRMLPQIFFYGGIFLLMNIFFVNVVL